jgi:hypothetical protein
MAAWRGPFNHSPWPPPTLIDCKNKARAAEDAQGMPTFDDTIPKKTWTDKSLLMC